MVKVEIGKNEENQRLDRFLRKYLEKAPLSLIYKAIRKDVKVNGKRAGEATLLKDGDVVSLYMSEEDIAKYRKKADGRRTKKQFAVAYEDENILIAEKPFGLLTHGDATEKKNHLANQVVDYLISKGDYNPRTEKTFKPASVNRLDRNTTGLVLFGKNSATLRELNRLIRERNSISKYYLTIVRGHMKEELHLVDKMVKDRESNTVSVMPQESKDGLVMETIARPLEYSNGYTLVEVKIITGRTHQIRAHLAKEGFPIIGDAKYGDRRTNDIIRKKYGWSTQLLHAYKLSFEGCRGNLEYLNGKTVTSQLPVDFARIKEGIF